jgi:hypothetical protein
MRKFQMSTPQEQAEAYELAKEQAAIAAAQAAQLRSTFERQGWSPQIAEQMAVHFYCTIVSA